MLPKVENQIRILAAVREMTIHDLGDECVRILCAPLPEYHDQAWALLQHVRAIEDRDYINDLCKNYFEYDGNCPRCGKESKNLGGRGFREYCPDCKLIVADVQHFKDYTYKKWLYENDVPYTPHDKEEARDNPFSDAPGG